LLLQRTGTSALDYTSTLRQRNFRLLLRRGNYWLQWQYTRVTIRRQLATGYVIRHTTIKPTTFTSR